MLNKVLFCSEAYTDNQHCNNIPLQHLFIYDKGLKLQEKITMMEKIDGKVRRQIFGQVS